MGPGRKGLLGVPDARSTPRLGSGRSSDALVSISTRQGHSEMVFSGTDLELMKASPCCGLKQASALYKSMVTLNNTDLVF